MRARLLQRVARACWLLCLSLVASRCFGAAPMVDRMVQRRLVLPLRLRGTHGRVIRSEMLVVLDAPEHAGHAPFLLLLHGRPIGAAARRRMGLVQFPAEAAYFAQLGYVVVVPTRVGYGMSGGPDVEDTGPCGDKNYARGMRPVVSETRQLLQWLRVHRPGFDWNRGLVLGDSFGGIAALAVAAARLPGVLGVVNISGGDGGDSVHRLDDPCSPWAMVRALAGYGRRARVPSLWMYSRNDYFWGTVWPRRWFDAYAQAGGPARFVELPADKNNGHFIFTRNPPDWQPAFARFAAGLGLP